MGQRARPHRGRVALAGPPLGATGTLYTPAGDESDLGGRDPRHRGRTGAGPLLSAVPVDIPNRAAADPSVAPSPLDRVLLSNPEAPIGHRGLSGAQRRCLLWPLGLTPDGLLCVILHHTSDLQRPDDD